MHAAESLRRRALEALEEVIDPELGIDVVALGLVYEVAVDSATASVRVALTMTTAACPLGEQIVRDAESRVRALEGVRDVAVRLVWEPPWSPERMSPKARELLGWPA
jgi:metal-sulfur cluster biosynthetic enzyme